MSATDKGTGKAQKITIQSSNLSKEQIEKMKSEAEACEAEDNRKKEVIEAKNAADSLVYQSEKLLKDLGDKATPEEKGSVEARVQDVKKAIAGNDPENIKKATEALNAEVQKLSVRLYQQSGAQSGASGNPGAGAGSAGNGGDKKDGNTVDAEFSD